MEPETGKQTSDLFIADDPIKTAKELQYFIDLAPESQKGQMVDLAIELLSASQLFLECDELLLDIDGQILLTDSDKSQERFEGIAAAMVSGDFERFVFWQKTIIGNLCLKLAHPYFIDPDESDLGIGIYDPNTMNLYVPVYAVENLVAA